MIHPGRSLSALSFALVVISAAACGGGGDSGSSSAAGAGTGGASAGAGGQAGTTSTGGATSKGGAASGAGGTSGKGGAAAAAGMSGGAGSAGKGGSPGGPCGTDADCAAKVPATTPAGCAVGVCDPMSKTCVFKTKDGDGDTHGTNLCKAADGTPIVLGDDCDDTNPAMYPGSWDGPKGDGNADRCDGIDENCDGVPDNQKLKDGTSCTCTPNDVQPCSEDSSGKPIQWPNGKPVGACKFGSKTCGANGVFGPCTGAVVPGQEVCNKVDDDCNGVVDDGPPPDNVPVDAVYFAYDGDNDQHARMAGNGYKPIRACTFNPPKAAPAVCTTGTFADCTLGKTAAECCPPDAWKIAGALQADDCNDENPKVNPTAPEICDGIDNDCDAKPDEACVCKPNSVNMQCSADTSGAPITWPTGSPVGTCKYGQQTCSSDGKSWGPCNSAISPKAGDNCILPGNDDNCNGVANDTCSCVLSQTQPCGSGVGTCKQGTSTCQANGMYGGCVGSVDPKPQDTCDTGNDDNCDGVANNGFPSNTAVCACLNGTTQACGTCGGGSQTCAAGKWGACLGAPSNVGMKCDAYSVHKGACLAGGTLLCDSANPTVPKCVPDDPKIYTDTYQAVPAPNGSWDWNCEGAVDVRGTGWGVGQDPSGSGTFYPNCAANCSGWIDSYQAQLCGYVANTPAGCNGHSVTTTCGVTACSNADKSIFCNIGISEWMCQWTGTAGSGYCTNTPNSYHYFSTICG